MRTPTEFSGMTFACVWMFFLPSVKRGKNSLAVEDVVMKPEVFSKEVIRDPSILKYSTEKVDQKKVNMLSTFFFFHRKYYTNKNLTPTHTVWTKVDIRVKVCFSFSFLCYTRSYSNHIIFISRAFSLWCINIPFYGCNYNNIRVLIDIITLNLKYARIFKTFFFSTFHDKIFSTDKYVIDNRLKRL